MQRLWKDHSGEVVAQDWASARAAAQAQAQAAPVEVSALPASMRTQCEDRLEEILPAFHRLSGGGYELELQMHFRRGESRFSQDRWVPIRFTLARGRISREKRQLVLDVDGRKIPVAGTRWWYDPKWYLTRNARVRERIARVDYDTCEFSAVTLSARPVSPKAR